MPFFGGRSIYKVVGTNIIGGNTDLPINLGNDNIAIGNNVLQNNVTGNRNIGIGNRTLNLNNANDNVAIGLDALTLKVTGGETVAIGSHVADTITHASQSVIVGARAGQFSQQANRTVAIGAIAAAFANITAYGENIAIGYAAGSVHDDVFNKSTIIGAFTPNHDFITKPNFLVTESIIVSSSSFPDLTVKYVTDEIVNSIIFGKFNHVNANGDIDNSTIIGNNNIDGRYNFPVIIESNVDVTDSHIIGSGNFTGRITGIGGNIILGDNNFRQKQAIDNFEVAYNSNIVIGNNNDIQTLTNNLNLSDNVIIAHGFTMDNTGKKVIQIGNKNVTYDEIWFGDQQYTGGGGGIPLEAEQDGIDTKVAIDGKSTDSVSGAVYGYVSFADAPNDLLDNYSYLENSTVSLVDAVTGNLNVDENIVRSISAKDLINPTVFTNVSTAVTKTQIYERADISGEPNITSVIERVIDQSSIIDQQGFGYNDGVLNFECSEKSEINAAIAGVTIEKSFGAFDNVTNSHGLVELNVDNEGNAELKVSGSPDGVTTNVVVLKAGSGDRAITIDGDLFEAGTDTPTLGATAPVAGLVITQWIKTNVGGVDGYIPFFSA